MDRHGNSAGAGLMSVAVAEYLGQSVTSSIEIVPHAPGTPPPTCPFTHRPCIKLNKRTNPTEPVCSIVQDGRLFPVCENRVLPSLNTIPSPPTKSMLVQAARVLF